MTQPESDPTLTIAERYFTEPAVSRHLPEESTTARVALHVVQSEALLDGDPGKNLATFVTTWMEPEARIIIDENLHRNYIDHAEYPRTAEIMRRCVRILHNLFHGDGEPDEPGAACAGSSEAVMLGALAMTDAIELLGKQPSLPLVIGRVRDEEPFDADDLVGELARRRGWLVPAYRLPPNNEDEQIIRILVKINQTRELADALADDIRDAIRDLRRGAAGEAVKRPVHRGHGY